MNQEERDLRLADASIMLDEMAKQDDTGLEAGYFEAAQLAIQLLMDPDGEGIRRLRAAGVSIRPAGY